MGIKTFFLILSKMSLFIFGPQSTPSYKVFLCVTLAAVSKKNKIKQNKNPKTRKKGKEKVLFRGFIWLKVFLSSFKMLNLRLMCWVQLRVWPIIQHLWERVGKAVSESLQFLNASGQTLLSAILHVTYWNTRIYVLAPENYRGIQVLLYTAKMLSPHS